MDCLDYPLNSLTDEINWRKKELQSLSTKVKGTEPLIKPVDYLTDHLGDLEDAGVHASKCWEERPNDVCSHCKDDLTNLGDDRPQDVEDREQPREGPLKLICEVICDDQLLGEVRESLCHSIKTFSRGISKHITECLDNLTNDLHKTLEDV